MQCAEDSAFYSNMISVLGLCRLLSNVPRFMRRKKTNMRITRSVVQVKILALVLAAPFCVTAQEKSHVTSDQVTHAIQEVEKLAQKQIQENTLATCSKIWVLRVRKFCIACAINILGAVFVRITRTRILG